MFTFPEFDKFARKARISDEDLIGAVDRADKGLVYADLGQDVIKLAIGRRNESARHGFRTILGFRREERAFFFFGLAKNQAASITDLALTDYRELAIDLFSLTDEQISSLVNQGQIREILRKAAKP